MRIETGTANRGAYELVQGNRAADQLKPIDPAAYTVAFTGDEMARLQAIFPEGVCDWTKPGVAQTRPLGPWYRVPTTPAAS